MKPFWHKLDHALAGPPVTKKPGALAAWPVAADYIAAELYAVAMAMADGSYYQSALDAQIEYCGGGVGETEWIGGEGGE